MHKQLLFWKEHSLQLPSQVPIHGKHVSPLQLSRYVMKGKSAGRRAQLSAFWILSAFWLQVEVVSWWKWLFLKMISGEAATFLAADWLQLIVPTSNLRPQLRWLWLKRLLCSPFTFSVPNCLCFWRRCYCKYRSGEGIVGAGGQVNCSVEWSTRIDMFKSQHKRSQGIAAWSL